MLVIKHLLMTDLKSKTLRRNGEEVTFLIGTAEGG